VTGGSWELRVDDVFEFEGPRTVLAGVVAFGPAVIPSGWCELVKGDRVVADLQIEGEMMPSRQSKEVRAMRAVSVKGRLPISRDEARGAWLRPKST